MIGRRRDLNEKDMERKASFVRNQGVEVLTYDRLLDVANELDARDEAVPDCQAHCNLSRHNLRQLAKSLMEKSNIFWLDLFTWEIGMRS